MTTIEQIEQDIREETAEMTLLELMEFAEEFGIDAFNMGRFEIIQCCIDAEVSAFVH